ncbi:SEL1-like repeat protein [Quatrionicoccus australiensis]|uniref:SEL1-like repeat protein n=1 Tax=Quatrionicoccus australiensis TaxID=138118 RepID=UPI001CFB8BCF|nr:sel1 repeat family protein [Quatrionicoccus australiensis]MCB4359528.1 sel1 repeat family protein [Quatrionicoccus australiensis]
MSVMNLNITKIGIGNWRFRTLICQFALILGLALSLTVDAGAGTATERTVANLPDIRLDASFSCVNAKIATAVPGEAEQLYEYARWLRRSESQEYSAELESRIESFYRIAWAYGHDKAGRALRYMLGEGHDLNQDSVAETLDLIGEAIRRDSPDGFFDMGRFLASGRGVRLDNELSWKYYRKSADLGSPQGLDLMGEALTNYGSPSSENIATGFKMLRCAAEQGHGQAARKLAMALKAEKRHAEALKIFQLGVRNGNARSASFLRAYMSGPAPDSDLYYPALKKDTERERRYAAIGAILSEYREYGATVPEIDQIVPLPPAKLPPWDGKLQWLEAHKANLPPPLPSEEHIAEMARAKGLDPKTGRPLVSSAVKGR